MTSCHPQVLLRIILFPLFCTFVLAVFCYLFFEILDGNFVLREEISICLQHIVAVETVGFTFTTCLVF